MTDAQSNGNIKLKLLTYGITRTELGKKIGRCRQTITVWLNAPLPEDRQKLLEDAIDQIAKEKELQITPDNIIKVKYHADIEPIEFVGGDKSDWIDLRAAETVELKAGEYKLISLGVSMELPKGYEAHVVPRSSTFKNFGVIQTNSYGVIDESYKGDNDVWHFPAFAMRDTTIKKGDRICQFRIEKKMDHVELITVDSLGNQDRGGIGSTGTR